MKSDLGMAILNTKPERFPPCPGLDGPGRFRLEDL